MREEGLGGGRMKVGKEADISLDHGQQILYLFPQPIGFLLESAELTAL